MKTKKRNQKTLFPIGSKVVLLQRFQTFGGRRVYLSGATGTVRSHVQGELPSVSMDSDGFTISVPNDPEWIKSVSLK